MEDLLNIRSNENSPTNIEVPNEDDFFTFHREIKPFQSETEELQQFLKCKLCHVEMLNDYPNIKKLFIKFNAPLPSSASVERLFSIRNSVLTQQRGCLHDDTMEHQLLLKVNKEFWWNAMSLFNKNPLKS